MTKNSTSFRNGNTAAKKHGVDAIMERGLEAMTEQEKGWFVSIRRQAATYPGRIELRKDLGTFAHKIASDLYAYYESELAGGIAPTDSVAKNRAGYYIALADRILAGIPDEDSHAYQFEHARIAEVIENDTNKGN